MKDIVEDSNFLNEYEKIHLQNILPNINFYWSKYTTSDAFPMYYHLLVDRANENEFDEKTPIKIKSEFFYFFHSIVDNFCAKHKIHYSNVIRACLNSTFHVPNYDHWEPHIDFSKEHYVLILYMSKFSQDSPTLIFDKCQNYDDKNTYLDIKQYENKLKIKKEIVPEFGKICLFDGKYYHSNKNPSPGDNRLVCVFNLLK